MSPMFWVWASKPSPLPFQIFPLHPRLEQLLQSPKSGQTAPCRPVSPSFFLPYRPLSRLLLVSRFIGQPLADHACQKLVGPRCVVHALGNPVVVPEIKLGKVSVKMLLLAVVVSAVDASLENAEIAFNGVSGDYFTPFFPDIFFLKMVNGGVLAARAGTVQDSRGVCHKVSVPGYHLINERPKVSRGDFLDVIRPDRSSTLNQGHDGGFVGCVSESVFGPLSWFAGLRADSELSADIGFVHLNDSTKRSPRSLLHCVTDSVSHEPSALERDAQGSMKLICTYTLLRSGHEIDGLKPEPQRNVAIFKDRSHLNRERLAADIALVGSNSGAIAVHFADSFLASTMRADGAIRPQSRLDNFISSVFIVEVMGGNN